MASSELEKSISISLGRSGGWAGFRSYELIEQMRKLAAQSSKRREAVTESYTLHETTSQSKKLESQSYELLVARSNAIIEGGQQLRISSQQLRTRSQQLEISNQQLEISNQQLEIRSQKLRTRNHKRIELAAIESGERTS